MRTITKKEIVEKLINHDVIESCTIDTKHLNSLKIKAVDLVKNNDKATYWFIFKENSIISVLAFHNGNEKKLPKSVHEKAWKQAATYNIYELN
jgi:hypothetical protein